MKNLEIDVDIAGTHYSQADLANVYDERAQHVLNEMLGLGATILDESGATLDAAGTTHLTPEQRRAVLLANKLRIGTDGLKRLYADKMLESDAMWHEIVAKSDGSYTEKVARTHIVIKGVNILKFGSLAKDAGDDPAVSLGANPEHFEVTNDTTGQHGFETMGQYGEPTLMDLRMGIKNLPEPADKHYIKRIVGDSRLAHDLSVVNAYAMHQVRPSLNGIELLTAAYFPSATPQELVDGHAFHLALEFSNVFTAMAGKK